MNTTYNALPQIPLTKTGRVIKSKRIIPVEVFPAPFGIEDTGVKQIVINAARIGDSQYRVMADSFTNQLKGIGKNTNIIIHYIPFPAYVLLPILRLLKKSVIVMTINEAIKTLEISYTSDGLRGKSTVKENFDPKGKFINVNYQIN